MSLLKAIPRDCLLYLAQGNEEICEAGAPMFLKLVGQEAVKECSSNNTSHSEGYL